MRPYLVCHMITSLDGRLWAERWGDPYEAKIASLINYHYDAAADTFDGDGWMVGRRTMAPYAAGERDVTAPISPVNRDAHIARPSGQNVAIALDPAGRLLWSGNQIDDEHVIVILSNRVEDAHLDHLRAQGVSYLFAGDDGFDLPLAMTQLAQDFGVNRLILEGGGKVNGAFLAAGLIDEMSTLICPTIDGLAGVPAIYAFEGQAGDLPAKGQRLELTNCTPLEGGVIWLRHVVHRS